MKKTLVTILATCALGIASVKGQGTFIFSNLSQAGGAGAPVTEAGTGAFLGANYSASFYWMAGTITDLSVFSAGATYYGNPVAFYGETGTAPAHGPAADGAGLFDGGTPVFGAVGTYTVQVVAFNGPDYANSLVRGASGLLQIGLVQNGGTTPLNTLDLLAPFTVSPIPEPSTFALAGLGLASLVIFRRRK